MTDTVLRAPGAFDASRRPHVVHELLARQRTLTVYAGVLLLLLVPAALAWGIDDRLLRGANVWIKPMKFLLSIAVMALTTAWFVGHLPVHRRGGLAVKIVVAMIVGAGSFELIYIAWQAALGQGSHFNVGTPFHAAMYIAMGIGAVVLTASQPLLAWQLYRHGDATLPRVYRVSVLIGLSFTFVLGAATGALLSGVQPPNAPGLPLLGWSTVAGDLRPAHFFGIHAEQLLPAAGLALAASGVRHAERWVWLVAAAYASGCALLVVQALAGRPFIGL